LVVPVVVVAVSLLALTMWVARKLLIRGLRGVKGVGLVLAPRLVVVVALVRSAGMVLLLLAAVLAVTVLRLLLLVLPLPVLAVAVVG
jgi:hypothetical protein